MGQPDVTVLLIEDNAGDARLIQELLRDTTRGTFAFVCADRLELGLQRLQTTAVDIVLLDLTLPDSAGLVTFSTARARAPDVPIVVLSAVSDESLAMATLRDGAQDYLVKGRYDGDLVARSIRYAIERHRAERDRLKQEAEIRRLNEDLERRVAERTRDLEVANGELGRRRRELQEYIDAMSTLNAKVAPDGTLLLVNRIAKQATGLSDKELERTSFLDGAWWAFDPAVQLRVRQAFRQACAGTPCSFEEKVFIFDKVATVHLSIVPVERRDHTVAYVIVEAHDISRRVEVEEALQAANRELEAFTYSVSHDLRAPIRQIDGFARILSEHRETSLDAKGEHYLMRIQEGAAHMGRLVDDLLHLARVGRQDLRPRSVSLGAILQEVRDDLAGETTGRQIDWIVDTLPATDCDPGLMKVVFTNLLSNAVKYTRRRQPASIEVGCTQRLGRRVIFVRDNGVGFDMKYAGNLFGVFQRLHRSDEFEGSGVGLATVQRIVHKHGGEIWAEAEPGVGATFFFTLSSLTSATRRA